MRRQMNISDVPDVLDTEVDPRLHAAIKAIQMALDEPVRYESALDAALDLLITAKGWLVVSKAMAEA